MQEMQETSVGSLGGDDPLEKEMSTNSSILAWRIPWTEKHGGLQSMRLQRIVHNWARMPNTVSDLKKGRKQTHFHKNNFIILKKQQSFWGCFTIVCDFKIWKRWIPSLLRSTKLQLWNAFYCWVLHINIFSFFILFFFFLSFGQARRLVRS